MAEMRLASQADAIRHLALKAEDPNHGADIQHLISIENALADVFEDRCGRRFGVGPVVPQTRRVWANPGQLLLPSISLKSVASISTVPIYATDQPLVIENDRWFPWGVAGDGGYVGIWFVDALAGGHWLDIEAVWSDQDSEAIPADVREAMTLLVIKTWRRYKSSPVEVVGGDLVAVPTPDGWSDSLVRNAIRHHQVHRRKVGV